MNFTSVLTGGTFVVYQPDKFIDLKLVSILNLRGAATYRKATSFAGKMTMADADPSCAGCVPEALTVPVTEPDFLDVPDFLRRGPDHTLWAWTEGVTGPASTPQQSSTPEDTGPGSVARRLGYPENPDDAVARAAILASEDKQAAATAETKKEQRERKAQEKKAKKMELHDNKMSQRREFVKHFKWKERVL
jgi:hypothetical protein